MKNKQINKTVNAREIIFNCERRSKTVCLTIAVLFFVFSNLACQPNATILNSGRQTSDGSSNGNSAERPKDTFESALRDVEKSGFDYIFVVRRKNGGQFDRADKDFVLAASPPQTNQFVLTEDNQVVIIGTYFAFPKENLEVLRERFNVEDLSPKKEEETNSSSEIKANANSYQTNGNLNKPNVNSNK